MLTIACVLKSGGIYDASWVARLRDGVARHLSPPYRFLCLSDVEVPCERIPLEHDWPGWWSKLELYKLNGPVLFFDLDTAIVGDISEVAAQALRPDRFAILRDFYRQGDGMGSGVLSWGAGCDVRRLFDTFASRPSEWMKLCGGQGDQNFIERQCIEADRWQDVVPGQIVSYKVHCRGGRSPVNGSVSAPGIPVGARVVCLHGPLKFANMPVDDQVRLAWEMAA